MTQLLTDDGGLRPAVETGFEENAPEGQEGFGEPLAERYVCLTCAMTISAPMLYLDLHRNWYRSLAAHR